MSFSRNFIEATPSDVAMLPEYDRLQIINDLANADSLAFRGNAINNYLRPFLKGVGTVGGALGGAAMGAPTGPGALFTGTLGAAGGNVLGDNIADAIAQLAGVPRSKGSLIDEIGYQTGNFAEGATLEAGGQVFNAALPFMAKVATPIASKSAELGLKALRSGEKVPAMVADVLGDSKFLEVFSRSPFFRKGLESVAKNPEKASSPIFRRMINQIGGRDAVIQLESMIRNEAKGAKPRTVTVGKETLKTIETNQLSLSKNTAKKYGWAQPEELNEFVKEAVNSKYPKGQAVFVGNFPPNVTRYIANNGGEIETSMLVLTDTRIKHMFRDTKQLRGQTATVEEIAGLSKKITDKSTRWFYDKNMNNVIFAFVRDGDTYIKVPVHLNRLIKGKKANEIATAGKTKIHNLMQSELREIK